MAHGARLSAPFVYDDTVCVETNSYLHSAEGLAHIWKGEIDPAGEMNGALRPLFLTFLAMEGALSNFRTEGFRAISILLHAINGTLLFLLAERFFLLPQSLAFATSLLFLLHPIHATSLALVWKQSDLWIGLFTLSSLLFLGLRAKRSLLIAFLLFLAAILTKESAFALPLLWLVFEPLLPSNGRKDRVLLAGIGLLISFAVYRFLLPELPQSHAPSGGGFSSIEYFQTQLHVLHRYFHALTDPNVLTIDQTFSPPLGFPLFGVFLLAGIALTVFKRWKSPGTTAILLAVVALIPTSSFHPLSLLYDETRLYLSVGFFSIAAARALSHLPHSQIRPSLRLVSSFSLAIILIGANILESERWGSEEKLWEEALRVDPRSPRAHYQLGWISDERREWDRAEAEYRTALAILPTFDKARVALGIVLGRKGNLEEAKIQFRTLLARDPYWSARGNYHLGLAEMYERNWETARAFFLKAEELDPSSHLGTRGIALLEKAPHLAGSKNVR